LSFSASIAHSLIGKVVKLKLFPDFFAVWTVDMIEVFTHMRLDKHKKSRNRSPWDSGSR
jgi:hypothetical protein